MTGKLERKIDRRSSIKCNRRCENFLGVSSLFLEFHSGVDKSVNTIVPFANPSNIMTKRLVHLPPLSLRGGVESAFFEVLACSEDLPSLKAERGEKKRVEGAEG